MKFCEMLHDLEDIKFKLGNKAEKSDLFELLDAKASKISNEKIIRLINLLQKQVSAISLNSINFIKLFHSSYTNLNPQRKNQDIEEVLV